MYILPRDRTSCQLVAATNLHPVINDSRKFQFSPSIYHADQSQPLPRSEARVVRCGVRGALPSRGSRITLTRGLSYPYQQNDKHVTTSRRGCGRHQGDIPLDGRRAAKQKPRRNRRGSRFASLASGLRPRSGRRRASGTSCGEGGAPSRRPARRSCRRGSPCRGP